MKKSGMPIHLMTAAIAICALFFIFTSRGITKETALQKELKLTVVYDNNPSDFSALRADWGFSAYVTGFEKNLLFDTGENPKILAGNLSALGIDKEAIDVIVLSHMHGDHIGGLDAVLHKGQTVFVPSGATQKILDAIEKAGATAIVAKDPTTVLPGIETTGTFDQDGPTPEQGLVLETPAGRVLVTGCAHPGIVQMVRGLVQRDKTPLLVLGGFHLKSDAQADIETKAKTLKTLGVQRAAPCHCSGDLARKIFAEVFDKNWVPAQLGTELRFSR